MNPQVDHSVDCTVAGCTLAELQHILVQALQSDQEEVIIAPGRASSERIAPFPNHASHLEPYSAQMRLVTLQERHKDKRPELGRARRAWIQRSSTFSDTATPRVS
ncbi:hypothetical protein MRX96_009020 [Rhipicephalus microplus]